MQITALSDSLTAIAEVEVTVIAKIVVVEIIEITEIVRIAEVAKSLPGLNAVEILDL